MLLFQYLFLILIFLLNIILGISVLIYNKKNKSNFFFFILTLITGSWVLSNILTGFLKSLFWFKIGFSIGAFLPLSALWWGYFFIKNKRSLFILILLTIISSFLAIYLHFSNSLINNATEFFIGRVDGTYGSLFPYYSIFLISSFLYLFYTFFTAYKRAHSLERIQLGYVILGVCGFGIIPVFFSLILPLFNIYIFAGLDSFGTIILVGMISYAILKHRLFDIVVIIKRVTIFFILISIVLGIFSAIAFGLPILFASSLPEESFQMMLVAVAFIVALFFQPLRAAIEEATDKWFFKGSYKPQEVIDELSDKISSIIDLRVLLDATARILLTAFRGEHAVFCVRERLEVENRDSKIEENKEIRFVAYNTEGRHRPMDDFVYDGKHPFTKFFIKYPDEVLLKDELQREIEEMSRDALRKNKSKTKKNKSDSQNSHLKLLVLKEMESHDFAVLFPVHSKEELVGIFGLGDKKSGEIYSNQDLQIIDLFGRQVGVAVENTKLYADLKLFNEKLQVEVDKATQDLSVSNNQLTLRNRDLGSLQKITNLITRTMDLPKIIQIIADAIQTELGYIGGIIYFYNKETKTLNPKAITLTPFTQKAIKLLPKSPYEYSTNINDDNLNIEAFKKGEVKMSNKFSDFIHPPISKIVVDEMQKIIGLKTIVAVPIFVENETIGLINFGLNKNIGEVTDQEIQMMRSLSDQMGIVIRNVQLYEAVKDYSIKLEEANEYLKELDLTKSEFISIASHQLRSPMTGIKGYLSMFLEGDFGPLDDKKKDVMKQMFDSSERLIRLINVFLNVSRIEAGRLHLDKREVNIEEVIQSIVADLSSQAKAKKLELIFEKPQTAIPVFQGDQDKLRDIVLNLVDNAIKYTAEGEVRVEVEESLKPKQLLDNNKNTESAVKDLGIAVHVYDTGIGLDPEEAKKLFDKFSRGKGIAQINPDGSGLGLYIAKKLSEAHDGGVWVESKGKGKGSTFSFWVPTSTKPSADKV